MAAKKLTDEKVAVAVKQKIQTAVPWANSRLSKERERVTEYYNGKLPRRQSEGSSTFVSTDVYDGIEAMKAQLLETFASGYDILQFKPTTSKDTEDARIATEYCTYQIHQLNPGYDIFNDVIHDGLSSRVGVVKVYWQDDVEETEEEFEGLDEETVSGLTAQEDIKELEANLDETTGVYSGTLVRKANNGFVKIEPIPPENFGINPTAKRIKGEFVYHRDLFTKHELIEMGIEEKLLEEIGGQADEDPGNEIEAIARTESFDDGQYPKTEEEIQEELKYYVVYECYIDMVDAGRKKTLKVLWCGGKVLNREEVSRRPFVAFRPLKIPHSFQGNNFAGRIIPTQNANTVLTRAILDHTAITVNPRYTVLQGGLKNPREMLDNRLGGLVNITRPDAVMPLMQANLNPYVFQTLGMISTKNEQTTGLSSLSQGLNKDAISKQNSKEMVQDLVGLSQIRQKIIARNFVNDFLVPLYLMVYDLVLENQDRKDIFEVAGNWQEVDPRLWKQRKTVTPSPTLGYGEQDRAADKLFTTLATLSQDPTSRAMMGTDGIYNGASDVLKLRGYKDVARYLTNPQPQPPPPDPEVELKKAELQFKSQELQAKAQEAEAKRDVEGLKAQMLQLKLELDRAKMEIDAEFKKRDGDRKDLETANRIDIAQREIEIVESSPAEPTKPIASPNS